MSQLKNSIKESLFYGKILLFGEYGVIEDSMALSIPFEHFNGQFIFHSENKEFAETSNKNLREYYQYLSKRKSEGSLPLDINLDKFKQDIDEGMLFDSSIPQGYGVGRLWRLGCASIYDKYAINKIKSQNIENGKILELKDW